MLLVFISFNDQRRLVVLTRGCYRSKLVLGNLIWRMPTNLQDTNYTSPHNLSKQSHIPRSLTGSTKLVQCDVYVHNSPSSLFMLNSVCFKLRSSARHLSV